MLLRSRPLVWSWDAVATCVAILLASGCSSARNDAAHTSDAGSDAGDAACTPDRPTCSPVAPQANADAPATTTDGAALHPRGFIGDPSILLEGGRYRMWHTSSRTTTPCAGQWFECLVQGFGYAESEDGQRWTPHRLPAADAEMATLVFEPLASGWDRVGVETASVLRGHDGRLWMFYTGHRTPNQPDLPWDAIGLAFSDDGLTWTRSGGAPVLEPTLPWERVCDDAACLKPWGGLLEPSVVWEEDAKRYRMWYAAVGTLADVPTYRIGTATSPDGLTWTKHPEPVLVPGAVGAWDAYVVSHVNVVRDPCRGYHVFYHGYGAAEDARCAGGTCTGYTPGSIGYAFGEDGITFERASTPLVTPKAGAWDAFFVGGPSALFRGTDIELFYFGNRDLERANAFDSQVGRVTLSCAP